MEKLLESNPEIAQMEARREQFQFQKFRRTEKHRWTFRGALGHSDSREKAIASFFPTFGPTYRLEAGVHKNLSYGLDLGLGLFVDQQSTTNQVIDRATRTGVRLDLSLDLWKNLFGRVDRAHLKDREISVQRQKLQSEIQKKVVVLGARKLYWSWWPRIYNSRWPGNSWGPPVGNWIKPRRGVGNILPTRGKLPGTWHRFPLDKPGLPPWSTRPMSSWKI